MKKLLFIATLLYATQFVHAGFWTHIWNNTKKSFFIKAIEQRKNKTVEIVGHKPAGIIPDTWISPFIFTEDFILSKKGKTIGFFENDFYLIPPKIFYDPKPYQSGNYIGGKIKALKFLVINGSTTKAFILKPSTYTFRNRRLEIQSTKDGGLKVRWYFGLSKGPWKKIPRI